MFNLPQSVDLNKSVKQINGIRIDRLAQLIERNIFLYFKKLKLRGPRFKPRTAESFENEPFDTSTLVV